MKKVVLVLMVLLNSLFLVQAQGNEKSNRFDGTWLGEVYNDKVFVTITGNEVIVKLNKSFFDEWVNFFEDESLNCAKGIIKANGNSVELTLTHIWGNLWAYFDDRLPANFEYWQTPKEFHENYGEEYAGLNFDEFMNEYSKSIFTASGIVSGNRMRLNWSWADEVVIITKQ
jgi:hypothetical protein